MSLDVGLLGVGPRGCENDRLALFMTLLAGLVLAGLSAWWAIACQARQALRAAVAEGLWAVAVVVGVGGSLRGPVAAGLFALGCAVGTWIVVRYARS